MPGISTASCEAGVGVADARTKTARPGDHRITECSKLTGLPPLVRIFNVRRAAARSASAQASKRRRKQHRAVAAIEYGEGLLTMLRKLDLVSERELLDNDAETRRAAINRAATALIAKLERGELGLVHLTKQIR